MDYVWDRSRLYSFIYSLIPFILIRYSFIQSRIYLFKLFTHKLSSIHSVINFFIQLVTLLILIGNNPIATTGWILIIMTIIATTAVPVNKGCQ